MKTNLERYQSLIDAALTKLQQQRIIERVWAHDPTLWPTAGQASSHPPLQQLSWLDSIDAMTAQSEVMDSIVDAVRGRGYTHALLLAMGGESLAAEVLRMVFGVKPGYLDLIVLNTTDPVAIASITEQLDASQTLVMVAGTGRNPIEIVTLFHYFHHWVSSQLPADEVGDHFVAIAGADSEWVERAKRYHFLATLPLPAQVTGCHTALTHLGLTPAALSGIDVEKLLQSAQDAAQQNRTLRDRSDHALIAEDGSWLAAVMSVLAQAGRDKVTLILSPAIAHFGGWVGQLITESIGFAKPGFLLIAGEACLSPKYYADDRLFLYLRLVGDGANDNAVNALCEAGQPVIQQELTHLYDLGAEFFRWQMASVVASHLLQGNPFDSGEHKAEADALLTQIKQIEEQQVSTLLPPPNPIEAIATDALHHTVKSFFAQPTQTNKEKARRPYAVIQAYLPPNPETDDLLYELRTQIQRRTRLATLLGYAPRFLYPAEARCKKHPPAKDDGGLFIQLTAQPTLDVPIPSPADETTPIANLRTLQNAQAIVDRQALYSHQCRLLALDLNENVIDGLERLIEAVKSM